MMSPHIKMIHPIRGNPHHSWPSFAHMKENAFLSVSSISGWTWARYKSKDSGDVVFRILVRIELG